MRSLPTPLWIGLAIACTLFIPTSAPGQSKTEQSKPDENQDSTKAYKVKSVKNIAYYDGPDAHEKKHKLDLYLPEGVKSFPILFFVHGGGWVSGDRNYFGIYSVLASTYAKQGIGVVVPSYRLSPAVKHPEHARDVARALAWTVNNIGKHGGDPDRVVLAGHSAGGHLVSLVTTDESYLKDLGVKSGFIKGVVPISGVYNIPERFMTNVFDKQGQQASPMKFIREKLPPFFILYADKDMIGCDKTPSEAFCKALKGKKITAETMEVKDSNHIDILIKVGLADTAVSKAIIKFIRERTEK